MQRYIDINSRNNHISIPSAVLLMACASLIFFLPAAVSMNAPVQSELSDEFRSKKYLLRPSGLLERSVGRDSVLKELPIMTIHEAYDETPSPKKGRVDSAAAKNKKSSLPLKTAATIGSSSAVAAAFLAASGSN